MMNNYYDFIRKYYEDGIGFDRKCKIQEFGKDIFRKEWIRDWSRLVLVKDYYDIDIYYVEGPIKDYCEKNGIDFMIDGAWIWYVVDRKQYNDISSIVCNILSCNDDYSELEA